jgi:hypothetical protein
MLPEAQNPPAHPVQPGIGVPIPLLVLPQFLQPIAPIAQWPVPVLRTTVPETPVDKDGKTRFAKNEVWLARQICVAPPAFDAQTAECRGESQFSRPIA